MISSDQNLLFGILALQNGFVARKQLIAAMNAWVLEKQTPLGQIMARQQALQPDEVALLETLVTRHLAAHDNDTQRSLASMASLAPVRQELSEVLDSDLRASLVHVSQEPSVDQDTTFVDYVVGAKTSAGLRFRKLRFHDKGGLGEVYVANDGELNRKVALKQIQVRFADQADSRRRFVREAEITGYLQHPGIVPVYGLGAYDDGRPFYAMRFIYGSNFKVEIDQFHEAEKNTSRDQLERTLKFRELLRHVIDACNAVEYAHAKGIVHRDLKPGNIMIGNYGETLVVDWGLAKIISQSDLPDGPLPRGGDAAPWQPSADSDLELTQDGSILGAPPFMSPEQAAGRHSEVGKTSDVYSLGATLYVLLTGQSSLADRPDDKLEQALHRVRRGDIVPPRQIKPNIPKPLEAICRKAMSLRPQSRYPTPLALADDLEHWLADEPISAQAESLSDRLFRLARRHRSVAITTTAAAILIATVASVAIVVVTQARQKADRLADIAKADREKALRLVEEAKQERSAAETSRKAAVASGRAAETSRIEAEESRDAAVKAKEEAVRSAVEKAALAEFLVGAIQPEDPTRFTGATFFAPKADEKTYRVVEMLKVELRRATEELKGSPVTLAAVLDSIGNVCRQLARFESAKPLLIEALRIRRKELDPDDPDLATSCFHTAWYYHERGEFEQAGPLYLEALRIRKKRFPGQPLEAETLQNLAWLYYYQDSPDAMSDCLKCFRDALTIREKLLSAAEPGRRKTLLRDVVFTKLGIATAYAGEKRLGLRRAGGIVTDPILREQLIELYQNSNLADALVHFTKAVKLSLPVIHDYPRADEELRAAQNLIEDAGKEATSFAGRINFERANILAKLNRTPEAEKEYQRAIEIARSEHLFQVPRHADMIKEYGDFLRTIGKASEANRLSAEYLAALEFRFGRQHKFYIDAEGELQTSGAKGAK